MRERNAGAATFRRVEVRRNLRIAPRFRRITVGGDELAGFADGALPGDAFKAFLPAPGERRPALPTRNDDGRLGYPEGAQPPLIRAYTVRRFDPDALELDLDVVLHDASPSTTWADNAEPGDEIAIIGPRHDFYASPEADWHLIAGDETALPAIAAILESLPAGARARVLIEVADADDQLPLRVRPGIVVDWLHRAGQPAGTTTLLADAVRDLAWQPGTVQAWVATETSAARAVRHLLRDRGVPPDATHACGYWRRGLDNAELDEIALRRYQHAQATGNEPDELEPEGDYAA